MSGSPSRASERSLLSRLLGGPALDRPAFLTGCGRSGTTILGTVLAQHPAVTYLNEPRDIWVSCHPASDIWSPHAARRGGRLELTRADLTTRRRRRLRSRFHAETLVTGRPRLLEKLPINNFRLGFVLAVFPEALFLHIVRHGVEVARSIARECTNGWYGADGYKWQELVRFAGARDAYRALPACCATDYQRGLLEWRLSVETALAFYATLPPGRHLQLRYEELLADPRGTVAEIERFLGLTPDAAMHEFAATNVGRRSPAAPRGPLAAGTREIAGDLLARLGYLA